jgi:hypothetical protein
MSSQDYALLLQHLRLRFEAHTYRHPDISWADIEARLNQNPENLKVLQAMEASGGEPDVVTFPFLSGQIFFCDCAPESPAMRRSLCYDNAALEARKEHKPRNSAIGMAAEMGITLLDESQYRHLQIFGPFDTKTSSWLHSPTEIRAKGGAIFGDYRYGHTFIYHNGAESYYAARGFRGCLLI